MVVVIQNFVLLPRTLNKNVYNILVFCIKFRINIILNMKISFIIKEDNSVDYLFITCEKHFEIRRICIRKLKSSFKIIYLSKQYNIYLSKQHSTAVPAF